MLNIILLMTSVYSVSQMLLNLHKKSWIDGLMLEDYNSHCKTNETVVKEMLELAKNYNKVCGLHSHFSKETKTDIKSYVYFFYPQLPII